MADDSDPMDSSGCFARSDPEYARWLTLHQQDGFVLYAGQELHRASCPEIAADPDAGDELDEQCFVGTKPVQLEYAALMLGGVVICERCQPPSDPDGVGMQAEYAARMRAKIARERGHGR